MTAPKLKWKRAVFKIAINSRAIGSGEDSGERKGIVSYPFGIHGDKHGWTITHLPSGLIATAEAPSFARAKSKVLELLALPVDWALANPLWKMDDSLRARVVAIARCA